jgi:hypothetical protein
MTDPQPLLTYRVATSPNPLQASSPTTPSRASITIAVFPGDQPVYCNKIQIAVPKNDADNNPYFSAPPDGSCSSTKWEIDTTAPLDDDDDPNSAEDGLRHYLVTFRTIEDDDNLIDYPLNFGLTGTLGTTTGTLTCRLGETSGTDNDTSRFTPKKGSFTMAVDPQTLYLNNFLSSDPGKPTTPRTKFTAGDPIYLTWESNGTSFQLYDGDGTVLNKDSDTDTHFTLENGITNDTTFTLVATLTSGRAQSQNDFQPIYQYATLTLTTTNPTLTDFTVTRNGKKKITTVDTNGLIVDGLLSANNNLTVSANNETKITTVGKDTLDVNGTLRVAYALRRGTDNLGTVTVVCAGDLFTFRNRFYDERLCMDDSSTVTVHSGPPRGASELWSIDLDY